MKVVKEVCLWILAIFLVGFLFLDMMTRGM